MGNIEYSPLLNKSQLTIELWKGAIKKKSGGKYSTKKLKQLEAKVQVSNSMALTLEEMQKKEASAWKEYWKNKKQSHQLQESYLEQKAMALEETSNLTKATIIKQILTREKQRKAARQVKVALRKMKGNNITTLETSNNGRKIEYTSKYAIEKICIEENRRKYSQTNSTVGMREPLRSLLGCFGDTKFCGDILQGTTHFPSSTPQYTKEFFKCMEKDDNVELKELKLFLTRETFQNGWRKMNERTLSGISG